MQTRTRKPASMLATGDTLATGKTVRNITRTKKGKMQVWTGDGHPRTLDPDEQVWLIVDLITQAPTA